MNEFLLPLIICIPLLCSCVLQSEPSILPECDGIDVENNIEFDDEEHLLMKHEFAFDHPDCANAILRLHDIHNVRITRAEEFFGRIASNGSVGYVRGTDS